MGNSCFICDGQDFLFATISTLCTVRWVLGSLYLCAKQLDYDALHSPPCAEIQNAQFYFYPFYTVSCSMVLRHKASFTLSSSL